MTRTIQIAADRARDDAKTVLPAEVARGAYDRMRLASLATVTGLLLLVACGGGGGTPVANMMPTTGPTTPVAPPQSTKPTTPTVAASQSPTGFPYTDLSVLGGP